MSAQDSYKTVVKPSQEAIFKDRGSKFLGYVFPLNHEEEVRSIITHLKDQHHKARHWCYAWRLGVEEEKVKFRINDDGEPNNSAGQPIYGQILSKGITNVLIVVVRYFGGTKLGVGGLINAYKTAAEFALDNAVIVEKTVEQMLKLTFEYKEMNKVMRIIKEQQLSITSQKMELNCEYIVAVKKSNTKEIKTKFENLRFIKVEIL